MVPYNWDDTMVFCTFKERYFKEVVGIFKHLQGWVFSCLPSDLISVFDNPFFEKKCKNLLVSNLNLPCCILRPFPRRASRLFGAVWLPTAI